MKLFFGLSVLNGFIKKYIPNNSAVAPLIQSVVISDTTPNLDQTLSATVARTGVPTPTLTYQWRRDGVNISGATGSTYTVVTGDINKVLTLKVIASNASGSANLTSSSTSAVPAPLAPPVNTVAPSFNDTTPVVGDVISNATINQGTWTGNPTPTLTNQLKKNGAVTTIPYTIVANDIGKTFTSIITAINTEGTSSVATVATGPVTEALAGPVNIVLPSFNDTTPVVGDVISVGAISTGTWSGSPVPTIAYQLKKNTANVAMPYTVVTGDLGATFVLTVTATNSEGVTTANSAATSAVTPANAIPVNTVAPSFNDTTPTVGDIISNSSFSRGTWTAYPTPTYIDVLKKNGSVVIMPYTVVTADVGAVFTITVSATNPVAVVSATSAATSAVVPANASPVNTVAPSLVDSTPVVGDVINAASVRRGTWTGYPVPTYVDQLKKGGTNVSMPYTVVTGDVGNTFSVMVTATSTSGVASATSDPTEAVVPQSVYAFNTVLPSFLDTTPAVGDVFYANTTTFSPGTWTGYPVPTFTYQIKKNDANVAAPYTVITDDVGSKFRVQVFATNNVGTSNATSLETSATTLADSGPVNTLPPYWEDSSHVVGDVITTAYFNRGVWSGSPTPTFTDQVKKNGTNITLPYTIVTGDVGQTLQVFVTANNASGTVTANSSPAAPVVPQNSLPVNTVLPSLADTTPVLGDVIDVGSVNRGTWTGYPTPTLTDQLVKGSNNVSYPYTVAIGDVGATFKVRVTATNSSGAVTANSASTTAVPAPETSSTLPQFLANPVIGDVIHDNSFTRGVWSGTNTYRWTVRRNGDEALTLPYTVKYDDMLATFTVTVEATNTSNVASSATSLPTAPVPLTTAIYVANNGSDSANGAINAPYLTLKKAHDVAVPGTTIRVRGGTYALANTIVLTNDGTLEAPIRVENYPGEAPIFDGTAITSNTTSGSAIFFNDASNWKIVGLEIKHAPDYGIVISGASSYNTLERIKVHHIGVNAANTIIGTQAAGQGFAHSGSGNNNTWLNCDSYYNTTSTFTGDGFQLSSTGVKNKLVGCRAWLNSADGFDLGDITASTVQGSYTLENCWAWKNGYQFNGTTTGGSGFGFKLGGIATGATSGNHILRKCAAWSNRVYGFHDNLSTGNLTLENCTAYNHSGTGTYNYYFNSTATDVLKNNLNITPGNTLFGSTVMTQTNSWDLGLTINSADFYTLNDEDMYDARLPNGSLPVTHFMTPVANSDARNAGTPVGIPFYGTKPDIGAVEGKFGTEAYVEEWFGPDLFGGDGSFTSGVGEWYGVTATVANVSGELQITATGASGRGERWTEETIAGHVYEIKLRMRRGTATNARVQVIIDAAPYTALLTTTAITSTAMNEYTYRFTATGDPVLIGIQTTGSTGTLFADDVTLREVITLTGYDTMIFQDEFEQLNLRTGGPTPDGYIAGTGRWTPRYNDDWTDKGAIHGSEYQFYPDPAYDFGSYTASNPTAQLSVSNSSLRIRAQTRPASLNGLLPNRLATGVPYGYVSGFVCTDRSFNFKPPVMVKARIKVPKGKAIWPAFWTLPADYLWPPEIDIMEYDGDKNSVMNVGQHPGYAGTVIPHTTIQQGVGIGDMSLEWHEYTLLWQNDYLVFKIDDVVFATMVADPTLADPYHYLVLNLAVGHDEGFISPPDGSTPTSADMHIDYVRVYGKVNTPFKGSERTGITKQFRFDFETPLANWSTGANSFSNTSTLGSSSSLTRETTIVGQGTASMKNMSSIRTGSPIPRSIAMKNGWTARKGEILSTEFDLYLPTLPSGSTDWSGANFYDMRIEGSNVGNAALNGFAFLTKLGMSSTRTWVIDREWMGSSATDPSDDFSRTIAVPINTWTNVKIEVFCHDTAGYIKIYHNGVNVFQATNFRTLPSIATGITSVSTNYPVTIEPYYSITSYGITQSFHPTVYYTSYMDNIQTLQYTAPAVAYNYVLVEDYRPDIDPNVYTTPSASLRYIGENWTLDSSFAPWCVSSPDGNEIVFETRQGEYFDIPGFFTDAISTNRNKMTETGSNWHGPTDDLYYEYKFMLDAGPSLTSTFFVFHEVHTYTSVALGSTIYAMKFEMILADQKLAITANYNPESGVPSYRTIWQDSVNLTRGVWHTAKIYIHSNKSADLTGRITVDIDGIRVVNHVGKVGWINEQQCAMEFGTYRGGNPAETTVVRFKDMIKLAGPSGTLTVPSYSETLGTEKVLNGAFTTATTSWSSSSGATLAIESGELKVTAPTIAGQPAASQSITVVAGTKYRFTGRYRCGTAPMAIISLWNSSFSTQLAYQEMKNTNNETLDFTFTAVDTTCLIFLQCAASATGQTAYFDNISIKPIL